MNSLDRYTSNRNNDTKLSVFVKFSSIANQNLKNLCQNFIKFSNYVPLK